MFCMTWEISLIHPTRKINSGETLETLTTADLKPLGRQTEVLISLRKNCPNVLFPASLLDLEVGSMVGDGYHLEFYLPNQEALLLLGVEVHSGDKAAVLEIIQNLCQATGWVAFDSEKGELIFEPSA